MQTPAAASSFFDLQGLAALRHEAAVGQEDPAVLRKVAQQFESLFTQQLLKAQRAASFGDPLFDSNAMNSFRDMHDQQLSVHLAESGGVGLADLIVAQLSRTPGGSGGGLSLADYRQTPVARAPQVAATASLPWTGGADFVSALRPHAERAAGDLGIAAELILAQAALETGWGEHVPSDARGTSFNLFGIKADARWAGDRVWQRTLEHDGVDFNAVREPFRRYDSVAASVDDYARFLRDNPRYKRALAQGNDSAAVAVELGRAGYATDPDYAQKIQRLLESGKL